MSIGADDLLVAFPTAEEIGSAQGSRFAAKKDFPVWTQAPPLTESHADNVRFGDILSTRPSECVDVTFFFNGGMNSDLATSALVKAVAFSNIYNSNQYLGKKVYEWQTNAFLMAPGTSERMLTNLMALSEKCKDFRSITTTGDVVSQGSGKSAKRTSGDAYVQVPSPANGGRTRTLVVAEVIGDVIVSSWIQFDASTLRGVSALYNQKADALAEAQGVERRDANLADLQPWLPDPSKFEPIDAQGKRSA